MPTSKSSVQKKTENTRHDDCGNINATIVRENRLYWKTYMCNKSFRLYYVKVRITCVYIYIHSTVNPRDTR